MVRGTNHSCLSELHYDTNVKLRPILARSIPLLPRTDKTFGPITTRFSSKCSLTILKSIRSLGPPGFQKELPPTLHSALRLSCYLTRRALDPRLRTPSRPAPRRINPAVQGSGTGTTLMLKTGLATEGEASTNQPPCEVSAAQALVILWLLRHQPV